MGFMGPMVMVDEGFRKIQLVTPIIFVQSLSAYGVEITETACSEMHMSTQ